MPGVAAWLVTWLLISGAIVLVGLPPLSLVGWPELPPTGVACSPGGVPAWGSSWGSTKPPLMSFYRVG